LSAATEVGRAILTGLEGALSPPAFIAVTMHSKGGSQAESGIAKRVTCRAEARSS
jgi:hypothetical protein